MEVTDAFSVNNPTQVAVCILLFTVQYNTISKIAVLQIVMLG